MTAWLIAARTLHYAATVSLEGIFTFLCFAMRAPGQAYGNEAAGTAALRRRLLDLAWISLLLALFSGAAWLFLLASRMSGVPLAMVLPRGILGIVLNRTQFGEDWLIRFGLVLVLAVCLFLGRARDGRLLDRLALLASAGLIASLAWAGHGGATKGVRGEVHLAADILHLLAAGTWLGALLPFAIMLRQAKRADNATALARAATHRFSTLGIASVTILLASGIVNTWFLSGTVPALIGTAYGRLLLLKIALFVAMVGVAGVNRLRLTPRLDLESTKDRLSSLGQLRRNALIETCLGLLILADVGWLGILPPGLHTEPRWPFPIQLDFAAMSTGSAVFFGGAATLLLLCLLGGAKAALAARYRTASIYGAVVLLCAALAWIPLRGAIETAYPTSFYASPVPYNARSVLGGAPLYAENCASCHGADGRGNGPSAGTLPIHPADLTEAHLFAHSPGDVFWWITHGRANGVMPPFAKLTTPNQRWDIINFIHAHAAGILTRAIGSQVTTAASYPVPDFAFESGGAQGTLTQTLKNGPVLLVLFTPPAPTARLAQLAAAQSRFAAVGLRVLAISLAALTPPSAGQAPPPRVAVATDVAAALALFRAPDDGAETELMLDRGADVRARWSADKGNLPSAATLAADAVQVAKIPVAAPSHAGHAH